MWLSNMARLNRHIYISLLGYHTCIHDWFGMKKAKKPERD